MADQLRAAQSVLLPLELGLNLVQTAQAIGRSVGATCKMRTTYCAVAAGKHPAAKPTGPTDFRTYLPRFTGDNAVANQKLVNVLQELAASLSASASQVAIQWVMARGRSMGFGLVPIVGARTLKQLAESLGAHALKLSSQDMARIEAALPADAVAGTRYDAYQMGHLDSEK